MNKDLQIRPYLSKLDFPVHSRMYFIKTRFQEGTPAKEVTFSWIEVLAISSIFLFELLNQRYLGRRCSVKVCPKREILNHDSR